MRGSSYHERDYAFGRTMLTVRTRIGLTQARLAKTLGVSRKAIGDWERGSSYPQAEHLKQFLALAIQHRAFPAGRVAEEVHAIWQGARQKVLFDETWLTSLLPESEASLSLQAVQETSAVAVLAHRVDWNDAPVVPTFYGREWEMDLLTGWVVAERCRVVSVLGLGGIGKSALAVSLMHHLAEHFEVVIWRSLRDLPTYEELLEELLQVLVPQSFREEPTSLERRQDISLSQMRKTRVLLVLDNLEAVLEEGHGAGRMQPGFEGFGRFLRLTAETEHQSCVLLTSRENPSVLVPMESSQAPVRALRLARLDAASCDKLLSEKDLIGSAPERMHLIEAYTGNPLALKIVAQTIVDLFDGEIAPFLGQGEVIFGGVRDLLEEQFYQLSSLEQSLLLWLAVLREPATLDELLEVMAAPIERARLLEALDALYRHSLIERGFQQSSFTLQSIVMEYLTAWLITQATAEIQEGKLVRLIEQGLELALAREDVRQTQERLIVVPILTRLQSAFSRSNSLEECLLGLLRRLASWGEDEQGYGPANLVTLLRIHLGNLRGLDLSEIALRGAYLQGVEMQDATLSKAILKDSNFTETFDAIWAVAISGSGQYWAASIGRGEVRVWETVDERLHWMWHIHAHRIRSLAFSPDSRKLAIGSLDGMIQLWDVASGTLLWSSWHSNNVTRLTFSPDGKVLASAGNDSSARLWDSQHGTLLQALPHPGPVFAVTWSPDGRWLASGDSEGAVRLWEVQGPNPAAVVQSFLGHTNWVRALCFSPDSRLLASGSYDGKVILWDIVNGAIHQMSAGQTDRIQSVTWSPNGQLIASSGLDRVIWLWEVGQDNPRAVLQGHTAPINGLAFTPDSDSLLSGSDDGSLRVWDVLHGQTVRLIQGYISALFDLDWSPDGTQIITGGANGQVTVWEVAEKTPSKIWRDHNRVVYGVRWSPDGKLLASSGWDRVIQLWDLTSETRDEIQEPKTFFYGLAWSPDGKRLACGTYLHGILVWEVNMRTRTWLAGEYPTRFSRVAWSPDRIHLAGGGDDGYIYLWDTVSGRLMQRLAGHHGGVKSIAWSPDGTRLASAGSGSEGGEILVWDILRGERIRRLEWQAGIVHALAWGVSEEILVSGSSDGRLCWWDLRSGECSQEHAAHQGRVQSLRRSPEGTRLASCGDDGAVLLWDLSTGKGLQTLRQDRPYERLNISGIRGLTEAQKEDLRMLGAIEAPNKRE
jgi:WD40 repeat protein/transcriptional regulator with XRE-family HTH domain